MARDAQAMVQDSSDRSILLFGGKGKRGVYLNDLWSFKASHNAWQQLKPAGKVPAPRFGHAMAYLQNSHTLLVFGGVLGTTTQPDDGTWAYSTTANTWHEVSSSTVPAARVYPSMVAVPATDSAILFGGWTGDTAFGDTWSYTPGRAPWKRIAVGNAPSARWGASLVLDSATGKLILFGGLYGNPDGSTRLNDTWQFDPAKSTWTQLTPKEPPPARAYAAMTYDASRDTILLAGGFAGPAGLLGDTWEYSVHTNTWSQDPQGSDDPSKRDFASMAYEPDTKSSVLFGGQTGGTGNINATDLHDVWLH